MLQAIANVAVVDDDPESRKGTGYSIEDAELVPVPMEEGPGKDVSGYIDQLCEIGAVVSDHQMKETGYSTITGADLVSRCYRAGVPGILCTKYDKVKGYEISRYRREIPVLLYPDQMNPETILSGLEVCQKEMLGEYSPERSPHKTLIRVEEIEETGPDAGLIVTIPAWDPHRVVRIYEDAVDKSLSHVYRGSQRFFALVNIGCESYDDLYISNPTEH